MREFSLPTENAFLNEVLYLSAMRYLFLAVILISGTFKGNAQIVNIESKRLQSDTTGWLGSIGTSFQLENSAVKVININAEAQLEYKALRSLYLFLANYNLLKGEGKTFQNNLFYHFRYNYKLNNLLRWEAFTQMQQNNIAGIKSRFLIGTGPRFKISGTEKLALYASTAIMYENEHELTKPITIHKDIRSSNYVSTTWRPKENLDVVTTIFYQPLYKDLSDFRLLHELSLNFKFTRNFSFVTTWNYLFDSEPAVDIPREIFTLKNGVRYTF